MCLESTNLLVKFKIRSIMSSVDKYTNFLDDKKEAVVTTPLTEKKLLTTENITKSDEAHKRTENITTSEEGFKGTDEVQKRTEKNTTNEEVYKGTKNWKIQKRQWSQSVGRIQISLRVGINDIQEGLILIVSI